MDIGEIHFLKLFHAAYALGDCLEISKHAAQPTFRDIRHPYAGSLRSNRLGRLLLGAYKKYRTVMGNSFLDEGIRSINHAQ